MVRTIWGQHERFHEMYFRRFPGYFSTNDGVRIDNDGFFWFMGRIDDVIKVRGQSLATSEIESVLASHKDVIESSVVSVAGEEGEELIAFIAVDTNDNSFLKSLEIELTEYIIRRIGEFAIPNTFIFATELPRTRTGKIVRRVLRRIASGDVGHDEDLSHIANPDSVNELIRRKGL